MLKKILTSPYFLLSIISIIALIILHHVGFNVPNYYTNRAEAQKLILSDGYGYDKAVMQAYKALINPKFALINHLYSVITLAITLMGLFLSLRVWTFKDFYKIFNPPPKWVVFVFINVFYAWFCLSQYKNMMIDFDQYVFGISDSFMIPIIGMIFSLLVFGVFYYVAANMLFAAAYKIKYKNNFLIAIFVLGIIADLCYMFLTCFNQKFTYLSVGDIVTNVIWIYLFLTTAKMIYSKEQKPESIK